MYRNQQPTRFGPNFERKICAASFSNTMPRGFIPTGRCFVMSLDLPISITRGYRAWKHRWTNICTGMTAIATSNTIALARRSCFIAGRNVPHGMVTRFILPSISICRISSRTRSMPRCANIRRKKPRSEEHTSELQSPDHLVCRLLLEKNKMVDLENLYAFQSFQIVLILELWLVVVVLIHYLFIHAYAILLVSSVCDPLVLYNILCTFL